jgi:hypothetical protein
VAEDTPQIIKTELIPRECNHPFHLIIGVEIAILQVRFNVSKSQKSYGLMSGESGVGQS